MMEAVRVQFRSELARCTERSGCPSLLHHSTCAEFRDLIRETPER